MTTSNDILRKLREFNDARDWGQFHSPENLAKSIAIEAGELLECFQWGAPPDHAEVRMELADVLSYAYQLADVLGENPETLILEKLVITGEKYPVEKAFGRSNKYDQL